MAGARKFRRQGASAAAAVVLILSAAHFAKLGKVTAPALAVSAEPGPTRHNRPMRFHATVEQGGKTATGITVPDEIVAALGAGKKPAVTVTINGYTYRTSIATVSGTFKVGVSAEVREAAGVKGGDEVDVEIALDTAPREVAVPADFAAALDAEPAARATFDRISYSEKRWFVLGIEDAKTPETRQRRIDKAIERLREGRGQR